MVIYDAVGLNQWKLSGPAADTVLYARHDPGWVYGLVAGLFWAYVIETVYACEERMAMYVKFPCRQPTFCLKKAAVYLLCLCLFMKKREAYGLPINCDWKCILPPKVTLIVKIYVFFPRQATFCLSLPDVPLRFLRSGESCSLTFAIFDKVVVYPHHWGFDPCFLTNI